MQEQKRVNQSNLRRQLFYWELKKQCRDVWHEEYNCDFEVAGSKQGNMSNYYTFLRDTLPFQKSAEYARLLKRDLQDATERRDRRDYIGADQWLDQPLLQAVDWYQEMTNDRSEEGWPWHSYPDADVTQVEMDQPTFWTNLLQTDQQCKEQMVRDARREPEMHTFRTWDQRKDESDDENEDEPEMESLFREWENVMLHCATVSVDSAERCIICVPFTTVQNVDVRRIYSKCGRNVDHLTSASWLARALAEATDRLFREWGDCFWFLL